MKETIINTEGCVRYIMDTYGVNRVGANDLLDDFCLWEEVNQIISPEENEEE